MASPQIQNETYESLRSRILNLDLRPGAALSEERLAQEYGVSRTPVREALIRLSGEGLIENSHRHRTFVTTIRFDSVMDGQFAREALETAIVHDVAQNMSRKIRAELTANLARQAEAIRLGNRQRLYRLDEQMHKCLASHSRRPGARLRKLTLTPDHLPTLLDQHRAIAQALFAEDPIAAAEAMRTHLRYIVEHYHELSQRFPEFVEGARTNRSKQAAASAAQRGRPPKLSARQREEILDLLSRDGMTGQKAARLFGVSPATISRIRRDR